VFSFLFLSLSLSLYICLSSASSTTFPTVNRLNFTGGYSKNNRRKDRLIGLVDDGHPGIQDGATNKAKGGHGTRQLASLGISITSYKQPIPFVSSKEAVETLTDPYYSTWGRDFNDGSLH